MNPLAWQAIATILSQLPGLIAAGQSVVATINHAVSLGNTLTAEKRDPTPDEWAAIDAQRDANHRAIQALVP